MAAAGEASPCVAIIVSSYNRPRLLLDALWSITLQRYGGPLLILVMDDGSDGITDYVPDYPDDEDRPPRAAWSADCAVWRSFDRICDQRRSSDDWRFLTHVPEDPISNDERQHGYRISKRINVGLRLLNQLPAGSQPKYVCYLCDDDFLTPRSIDRRVEYLEQHLEANVVYGRLESCTSNARVQEGIHYVGHPMIEGEPPINVGDATNPSSCQHAGAFFDFLPIIRAANRVDHNMFMHRWPLPGWGLEIANRVEWPEERSYEELSATYRPEIRAVFDCPDAGFLYRLERAGWGPFHSVNDVVCVKRYHSMGHRTHPSRRE